MTLALWDRKHYGARAAGAARGSWNPATQTPPPPIAARLCTWLSAQLAEAARLLNQRHCRRLGHCRVCRASEFHYCDCGLPLR